MAEQSLPQTLNRSVKIALDSGEAATLAEAERQFAGYQLHLDVGPRLAHSPTLQAALLTAVNTGRRCFLGGVKVTGEVHVPLLVPWLACRTLDQAISDLQGQIGGDVESSSPTVLIGGPPRPAKSDFSVQVTFDGWTAGVLPASDDSGLPEDQEFTPAGVLAGAAAVSEAFQSVRGNAQAGRRAVGFSLWRPEQSSQWLTSDPGPVLSHLPRRLWLIGLGHLGQAYLWTLGLLPFAQPNQVELTIQDFDRLAQANDSTSLLTREALVGQKKTRALAAWCDQRGFQSVIVERRFAGNFRVAADEPSLALCGVDNTEARAALEDVGFARVIEAGLGNGPAEYLAFQIHGFPAAKGAAIRWGRTAPLQRPAGARIDQPAYAQLAQAGLDQCGLTELAGRAVGAAFVGAATSAFVVAEALRTTLGDNAYEIIDGTLQSPADLVAVQLASHSPPFNPGLTPVASICSMN